MLASQASNSSKSYLATHSVVCRWSGRPPSMPADQAALPQVWRRALAFPQHILLGSQHKKGNRRGRSHLFAEQLEDDHAVLAQRLRSL
jgi:hypothetical protein